MTHVTRTSRKQYIRRVGVVRSNAFHMVTTPCLWEATRRTLLLTISTIDNNEGYVVLVSAVLVHDGRLQLFHT